MPRLKGVNFTQGMMNSGILPIILIGGEGVGGGDREKEVKTKFASLDKICMEERRSSRRHHF